jgi:hypothetical protein
VKFLVGQHLADVNFSDCLIDWVDRLMQPHFVAPLTSRGRKLVDLVSSAQDFLAANGGLPKSEYRVAQESFFEMPLVSEVQPRRMLLIRDFQQAIRISGGLSDIHGGVPTPNLK